METVKYRIGDIKKAFLTAYDIDISDERIRRYQELDLFSSSRDKETDYREYSEEEMQNVVQALKLIEIGVNAKDVLTKNDDVIAKRITSVDKIIKELKAKK